MVLKVLRLEKINVGRIAYAQSALIFIFGLFGSLLVSVLPTYAFAAGDGTELDPYIITNCVHLAEVDDNLTSSFRLDGDINCTADGNDILIGTGGTFQGTFDGDGHTITVDIDAQDQGEVGLFKRIINATIYDLTVSGSVVNNSQSTGLLAGRADNSTITNVHTSGTVTSTADIAGGLFGAFYCDSTIEDSSSSAVVSAAAYVGGLIGSVAGECDGPEISDSFATGNVTGTGDYVGGFLGGGYTKDLEDIYATGNVVGSQFVGGLAGVLDMGETYKLFHAYATGSVTSNAVGGGLIGGMNNGTISQSYATGDVTGYDDIGGFMGLSSYVTIRDSYARGDATINMGEGNASAFIGYTTTDEAKVFYSYATGATTTELDFGGLSGNGSARFYYSFWDQDVSGAENVCDSGNCRGGSTGKTTTQMKTTSTYTDLDWNFESIWARSNGTNDGYPTLLGGNDVVYETPVLAGHIAADKVLGQPNFTTNEENLSANGFDEPSGVSLDRLRHRMFVMDGENNRVLVYNLSATNELVDYTPDFVLGQPDFESNEAVVTRNGLDTDDGSLIFDEANNRLFVSDEHNQRILVFDATTLSNGMDAAYVLGQPDFTTEDSGTTINQLDYNESTPAYDPDRQLLFVPEYNNNRVMIFDVNSITNGEDAVYVLGQDDFESNDSGTSSTRVELEYVGSVFDPTTKRLYLSDQDNNRVLVFDTTSLSNGMAASYVLGQEDFESGDEGLGIDGLDAPTALTIDTSTQTLYVADSDNYRVMIFDVNSITNGEDAIDQIGQYDFDYDESDQPVSATSVDIDNATGMYFDEQTGTLYTAEQDNNRVLVYEDMSEGTGIPDGEDLNGDDIPDVMQPNVGGYVSNLTNKTVAIDVGEGCELTTDDLVSESNLESEDTQYNYPNGLFDFAGDCGADGFETTVKLYYYDVNVAELVFRKFDPRVNEYKTIESATVEQQTINGSNVAVVTYSIVDGGELDTDGEVNGEFTDPAGLATDDNLAETGQTISVFSMIIGFFISVIGLLLVRASKFSRATETI